MNEYVTDDEQVEKIKKWWSDNGSSVVAGLIIGVGGLLGWRYWVDYKQNVAAEASAHFANMVNLQENNDSKKAVDEAYLLLDEYGSTAYAELARLSLGRIFAESKEYGKAEQQFQLLVDSTSDSSLEMIARKRLALVQQQQGKLEQAMDALSVDYPVAFTAAFEELKGDILAQSGKSAKAREAYQKARLAQPPAPNPEFLQQKIDDLGLAEVTS